MALMQKNNSSRTRINPDSRKMLWFTIVLVGLLGFTSFVVSFNGLHDVAAWVGLPWWLRWAVPVFIDIAILAYSMAAVIHRARNEPVALTWLTLGVFTSVSVVANAAHALAVGEGSTVVQSWIGAAIASAAPLSVFAATEELSRLAFGIESEDGEKNPLDMEYLEAATVANATVDEAITPAVQRMELSAVAPASENEGEAQNTVNDSQLDGSDTVPDSGVGGVSELRAGDMPGDDALRVAVREAIAKGERLTGAWAGQIIGKSARTGLNRLNALRQREPELFEEENK